MASLALRNVCKRFGENTWAVRDFNLDVKDGEFIIFVGPSGCGKSTTLRMIAGLEEISEGELWVDGELMNYLDPQQRNLSMVFQNYALYPNMTVYDNMAFSLKVHKIPKKEIDHRVREVADVLEIGQLLKRYPAALSGGQKQRVAIGSAIIRNPKVFLMDEPLSNLDAKLRAQMRVELGKLHKRLGATIIYVTHDQTEAMTLGTRIVVMKEGRIQQVDTPQNLYEHPVNQFVAGFIGSPAMNFLNVRLSYQLENRMRRVMRIGNGIDAAEMLLPPCMQTEEMQQSYNRDQVILGIRPEDLYTEAGRMLEENREKRFSEPLTVEITARELLGVEVTLYFNVEGVQFCARVEPDNPSRVGDLVKIYLDMDRLHFFDSQTGEAVLVGKTIPDSTS